MSYEQHFGLTEQPFSNAADSRFFFESEQHQDAMLRISHSVSTMKGLTVVIGGAGAGKTLLARYILAKLEEKSDEYEAALLVIVHSCCARSPISWACPIPPSGRLSCCRSSSSG